MSIVNEEQALEFGQIIRNAQRHHQVYSVGGGMWQVQTADGDGIKNLTWEEFVAFSEECKNVPIDSIEIRRFNVKFFDLPREIRDVHIKHDYFELDDGSECRYYCTVCYAESDIQVSFEDPDDPDFEVPLCYACRTNEELKTA